MKREILLFLALFLLVSCLTGCTKVISPSDEVFTDYEGIYITIDSVDDGEKYPVLNVMWHNTTNLNAVFGMGYFIERLDEGRWVDVRVKDFAVIEIACILEGGDSGVQSYSTEYFNLMKSGIYRIRTEFYVHTENESTVGVTYATFEVGYEK